MSEQFGWLVELGCSPPKWWAGQNPYYFTTDANEAMRFSRREDAERAIGWLVAPGWREGCRALEHGWMDVPALRAAGGIIELGALANKEKP